MVFKEIQKGAEGNEEEIGCNLELDRVLEFI